MPRETFCRNLIATRRRSRCVYRTWRAWININPARKQSATTGSPRIPRIPRTPRVPGATRGSYHNNLVNYEIIANTGILRLTIIPGISRLDGPPGYNLLRIQKIINIGRCKSVNKPNIIGQRWRQKKHSSRLQPGRFRRQRRQWSGRVHQRNYGQTWRRRLFGHSRPKIRGENNRCWRGTDATRKANGPKNGRLANNGLNSA